MQFLRLASVYLEPPPKNWSAWHIDVGDSHVSTIPINKAPPSEGRLRLLLKASTEIKFPEINDDGYIVLPEDKRRALESAIVIASDLAAVLSSSHRLLLAARPSVALIPKNNRERRRLDATKGFLIDRTSTAGLQPQIPKSLSQELSDRLDGVALMAEAQSNGMASGQFREYVRLFEAAFGLSFHDLSKKKLVQFLPPGLGYTCAEIRAWFHMRDPLTHADYAKSKKILVSSDVRKVVQRMQQAAYDVLFNKAVWRDHSISRRALWTPPAVTISESCELVIRRASEPTLRFQHFDEFGVFPVDLQSILKPIPSDWWFKVPAIAETQTTVNADPLAQTAPEPTSRDLASRLAQVWLNLEKMLKRCIRRT